MKNTQLSVFINVLFMFVFLLFASSSYAKGLNADELKALINDKTVESESARGFAAKTYYKADGTYRRIKKGESTKGEWYIDSDGKLCKKDETESTAACRLMVKKGNVWKAYKIPSKATNPWKHKGTWLKILDGNPHNL